MNSFTFVIAASMLAIARAQDRYQKVGNDVGSFYSSVGAVLSDKNADAASLSSAAQQADVAIASFKNEIRTMDWSDLGDDAAKQQTANLELYLSGLEGANAELHAIANKAAIEHANNNYNVAKDKIAKPQTTAAPQQAQQAQQAPNQPQQQAQQFQQAQFQQQPQPQQRGYINNRINAVVTDYHNKAVIKEASTTITSSSEPTESASSLNSKESKSESKESKKESKSESKESKKESKSESKESKQEEKSASSSAGSAAAASATSTDTKAATSSASSASESSTKHSKNNAAIVATGFSGSALLAAIFALI